MSAVVQVRQRPAAAWRWLHWLLRVLLLLVLLVVLGAAILAWRLAQGPMDVGWLARRIETAALPPDGPAHLVIRAASIGWNGFRHGADGALELRLRDVQLVDRAGAADARLDRLDASLSLLRLLEGRLAPRSVALAGLRLGARRTSDGTFRLDLGGLTSATDAPSVPAVLAELRQPALGDGRRGGGQLRELAQLQRVQVHDAVLQVRDMADGRSLRVRLDDLDLERQIGGGVKGVADGEVALGSAAASLRLQTTLLAGGGTRLAVNLAPMRTAAIAHVSPELAPLAALDAQMTASASLDLAPDLSPRRGEVHLGTNGGLLTLPAVGIPVERLAVDATATWSDGSWRPDAVAVQRALAVIGSASGAWSTTLSGTANVTRASGKLQAAIDLSLDHLALADLPKLWPAGLAHHIRPWLTENLTAGTLRNGSAVLTLSAPETNPTAVAITAAHGALDGDDLTINWLRPVPPIEHAKAHLSFVNPDEIDVAVSSASQGALAISDTTLKFTSLQEKDQFMALVGTVTGPVADTLQLLKNPRLQLLDKHPMPIKSAAGTMVARLNLTMPMKDNLHFEQIKIAVQGTLSALRLGGIVAGRDLDQGDLRFDVTQDGLKASGTALLGGIPATLTDEMDFRAGPPTQMTQRSTAVGRATMPQLTAAGVDPGEVMTGGQVALSATYTVQRNGAATVGLKADFKEAAMALAGWSKPIGPPANGSAEIVLQNDRLREIREIGVHGPRLDIAGRADLVDGHPRLLRLSKIEIGGTRATGEVRLPASPAEPLRATLRGSMLDLSTELSGQLAGGQSAPAGTQRGPWTAQVHFDRVELVHGRTLENVNGRAEDDGTRLRVLDVTSGGPERLRAVIAPQGIGRRISVRADNAGAILQALDVTSTVTGGSLALDGTFDDRVPYSPLNGTLNMTDFAVHDAVAVGKVLQAVTVYGLFDAIRGTGVQFSRLYLPFRYDRRQIHIGEARAFSASLGLTASGWIDLARRSMDVRGTLVPAYAVNSALGRIPIIGRLFSPERGGGLVAVSYTVTGGVANPVVVVNPLSALTPGFLRGLFGIFR